MKILTLALGMVMAATLVGSASHAAAPNSRISDSSFKPIVIAAPTPKIETAAQKKKAQMKPITLYELNSKEFTKKTSEIPSYHKGKIEYWTEETVQSFNEGHSVTWGDPLVSTYLRIANLIPYEYFSDRSIDKQLNKLSNIEQKNVTITTANGISFTKKPTNTKTGITIVQVKVPEWGLYVVTWNHGKDSSLQIIQKITFQPETQQ